MYVGRRKEKAHDDGGKRPEEVRGKISGYGELES